MRAALLAACILAIPCSALAEPPVAGLNPDRCVSRFTQEPQRLCLAAVAGDPAAQRAFARALAEGLIVPRDDHAAAAFLQAAALAGNAGAAADLGRMVETGRGLPRDLERAREWYRRAADGGDIMGAHFLGLILDEDGTRSRAQDLFAAAIRFAEPRLAQGDPDALFVTGAYTIGMPVVLGVSELRRDRVSEALARLRRAADAGHVPASALLGQLGLTQRSLVPDLRETRRRLAFAAARNDRDACLALASLIIGTGGANAPEHPAALPLLHCAAEQGSAVAAHQLGNIYADRSFAIGPSLARFAYGPFLRPDLAAARRWYARAAALGHAGARFDLAIMLVRGEGGPHDEQGAIEALRAMIAGQADDAASLNQVAQAVVALPEAGRPLVEAARDAVESAMRRRNPEGWVDTLALAHLRLGEPARAEALLRAEIARRGDPDNIDIVRYRIALGDVLAAQRRMAEARAEWERVLPQVRGMITETPVRRRIAEVAPQ